VKVTVLGDGAWGRALAHVARAGEHDVEIWSRRAPFDLTAQTLIVAVPAQSVRDVLKMVPTTNKHIIIAAKGIERGTHMLMADVVRDVAPSAIPLVLSGPSFADDVVKGLPTAVTLAADDLDTAKIFAQHFSLPHFRLYASDDVRGVELGGALKNVLAIACGISDGLGLGESARAALTTRGFAELSRLAEAMGAQPRTLMGLSGIGDLLLTASSTKSRNYAFGFRLGQGLPVAEALAQSSGIVEGAFTALVARALAAQHNIDMPIINAVHAIVEDGAKVVDQVTALMQRPAAIE
jgi:glycerol-3-phosphate dehydrogenase (NAD(P)+)